MLTAAGFIDAARAATGLADFGGDSFREGLEIYLRALGTEAKLNTAGEAVHHRMILNYLKQRLQVEDWYRRHPEIDAEPIVAPLIGLGLPRTGSTALSFLLAQDPNIRYLRRWESGEPCPPPSTVKGLDPRLERALEEDRKAANRSGYVPSTANGPMECQELMALDFKCHMFPAMAQVPSYAEWVLNADLTSTYQYERRVLKLLQWGSPTKSWRLKCPNHIMYLDHLVHAFPDARFVMTHRDPTDVMLSVSTVYAEIASRFTEKVDWHYMAELNVHIWSIGMGHALKFRNDPRANARFYDLDFRTVQSDPIGQVRGLYAWLGEPVTPAFETGMAQWWKENAENREPGGRPDPAKFGLDLDKVRPLFAEYTARAAAWTAR